MALEGTAAQCLAAEDEGQGQTFAQSLRRGLQDDMDALLATYHAQLQRHFDEALASHCQELQRCMASRDGHADGVPRSSVGSKHSLAGRTEGEASKGIRTSNRKKEPSGMLAAATPSSKSQTGLSRMTEREPVRTFSDSQLVRASVARDWQWSSMVKEDTQKEQHQESKLRHLWQSKRHFVSSSLFEILSCFLIISNALIFGIEVEYMAQTISNEPPLAFVLIMHSFTVLFLLEFFLRMSQGFAEFCGVGQWYWNMMDFLIVATSVVELALDMTHTKGGQTPFLRVTRIIRTVRIIRIIRALRLFPGLRVLVGSVMTTLQSLAWTLLLLTVILYIFAIVFTEAATQHVQMMGMDEDLWKYFGSLLESVLTLFKTVAGGVSWHDVSTLLREIHPVWELVFLVFFFFTYLAVLNVVTGMFCQSAIEQAVNDKDMLVKSHLNIKKQFSEQLTELFQTMDSSQTGHVTLSMFEESLHDPELQAYFDGLDITIDDAWNLFKLLDNNESNAIDIEEFVTGCLKLKGRARSVDTHMLLYESRWTMRKLTDLSAELAELYEVLLDSRRGFQKLRESAPQAHGTGLNMLASQKTKKLKEPTIQYARSVHFRPSLESLADTEAVKPTSSVAARSTTMGPVASGSGPPAEPAAAEAPETFCL